MAGSAPRRKYRIRDCDTIPTAETNDEAAGLCVQPGELARFGLGASRAIFSNRTVAMHVRRLLRKLKPNPSKARYIQSIRGFGYAVKDADAASRNLNAKEA